MNDDQITVLAHEYAEEKCGKENESPMYFGIAKNEMEEKLHWLSRRYCLVEKEEIEKYFQSLNYILTHQDKYEVYIVRESEVEKRLLDCLFPEMGKEVQK